MSVLESPDGTCRNDSTPLILNLYRTRCSEVVNEGYSGFERERLRVLPDVTTSRQGPQ
jgi:hypothetical protein